MGCDHRNFGVNHQQIDIRRNTAMTRRFCDDAPVSYEPTAADLEASKDKSRATPADDLRAENERLRALVDSATSIFANCTVTDGVCCCGDNMEGHADPMNCGHSPVDHGAYAVDQWCKQHAALSQNGGAA